MSDITAVLNAIEHGESQDVASLLPLVYEELRRMARAHLCGQAPGQTLQPTALVHEMYLKVGRAPERRWASRRQFFAYASETMRRILVDRARAKLTAKRGAGGSKTDLIESRIAEPHPSIEALRVHEALDQLEASDPEAAELVRLRYFVGFTMEEAASIMGMSLRSVERLWTYARTSLKTSIAECVDL